VLFDDDDDDDDDDEDDDDDDTITTTPANTIITNNNYISFKLATVLYTNLIVVFKDSNLADFIQILIMDFMDYLPVFDFTHFNNWRLALPSVKETLRRFPELIPSWKIYSKIVVILMMMMMMMMMMMILIIIRVIIIIIIIIIIIE